MRKHLLIALIGVVGLGGVALAAGPQGREPGRRPGRDRHPPLAMLKGELGLDEAQTSQLRELWSQQRKSAIRRQADMRIGHLELNELLDAATIDEKALSAKMKELSDLHAAALKARVDGRLALRKVLTPEQLAKMKELHRGPGMGRGPRGPHRGPMGRPGGGPGPGDGPEEFEEELDEEL